MNNQNKMLDKYIEDVNEIFHYTKKDVGYNKFTNTSKKAFEKSINKCKEEAISAVRDYLKNGATHISMLEIISFIQDKTKELLTIYKIQDQLYKSTILCMVPGYEEDSTKVVNINQFKFRSYE